MHRKASIQARARAIARDDLRNFQFDEVPREDPADFTSFSLQQSAAGHGALVLPELLPGEGYSLPLDADVAFEIVDGKTKRRQRSDALELLAQRRPRRAPSAPPGAPRTRCPSAAFNRHVKGLRARSPLGASARALRRRGRRQGFLLPKLPLADLRCLQAPGSKNRRNRPRARCAMEFLIHVKGKDQGPSEARASLEATQRVREVGGEPGWRQLVLDNAAGADQLACQILTAHPETQPSVILAHRTNDKDLGASLRLIRVADNAQEGEILASEEFYHALDRSTQDRYGTLETRGNQRLRPRFRNETPAFVISPIGLPDSEVRARADLVFDKLIKPACRKRGLRPERADQVFTDQIRGDMMRRLARDTVVLAYLDRDPWSANVMLEVGFRLQSGRPVVFLMDGEAKDLPPFDLGDRQVLQVPSVAQLAQGADDALVEKLAGAIRDALAGTPSGDDWPHPVASIRMRLGKEGGKHPVQEAYGSANHLFNRSSVAGTHVAELIEGIRPFMPKAQFESFSDEQSTLIGKLVQAAGSPGTVRATVPMFFATHPDPSVNHRAFLPVIVSYRIDQRDSELGLLVLYLEVTAAASVDKRGIVRCEVSNEGDRSALFWDLYASSYDEILPRLSFYKTALERHFRALSGCAQVLEIGAGTGNLCQRLVAAGANVTAVDRSRAMADRMRDKRRAMRVFVDRWCILHQGAESLAIVPDRYVDGVSILLSLFAMQTPRTALKEALRVLKPGGTLVVTEPKASFDIRALLDLAQKELEEDELDPNDEHWARVKDVNLVIAPSQARTWMTAERIRERLEAARFTIESVEDSHHGHCATLVARAP